jgi:hypothetical protein
MEKFLAWLKQPTTINGLGMLVGGISAGLAHVFSSNVVVVIAAGLIANILTHFGINDNSNDLIIVEHITEEVAALVKDKPNA